MFSHCLIVLQGHENADAHSSRRRNMAEKSPASPSPRKTKNDLGTSASTLTPYQVAKIRPTDYTITDRHAQRLIEILSDGKQHDMLDELNRFAIDAVSDIFYGTSTYTLGSSDQSLRDSIQRQKDVNTWRLAFG